MRPRRRNTSWRLLRRRSGAALALVVYLAATIGFPLPAQARKAGRASCQGGACGCSSAAQRAHTCCCCPTPPPACPHCRAAGGVAECCRRASGCSACAEESSPGPATLRWVQGVSVMRCRGLNTLWMSSGAALPPPVPVTWDPAPLPADWLSDTNDLGPSLPHTPPAPPPRCPGR